MRNEKNKAFFRNEGYHRVFGQNNNNSIANNSKILNENNQNKQNKENHSTKDFVENNFSVSELLDKIKELESQNKVLKLSNDYKDQEIKKSNSKIKDLENTVNDLKSEIFILKEAHGQESVGPKSKSKYISNSNIKSSNSQKIPQKNESIFKSMKSLPFPDQNFFDQIFPPNNLIDYERENFNPEELIDPIKEYEDHIINELCPNPDHMTYEQLMNLQENIGTVSKGLSANLIAKLPTVSYSKYNKTFKLDKCVLCQYEFKENEQLVKLNCNHTFHSDCIGDWLRTSKECPLCKKEVKPSK